MLCILISWMSWLNMDASIGFNFNYFDSNSSRFYHIRDDSHSYNPLLFQNQDQIPPMYDQTVNFEQLSLLYRHQEESNISQNQLVPKEQQEQSSQRMQQDSSKKRGLRSLAELLLKILKRRSLLQTQIVSLIEDILCKGKHQEGGKQEKNIKRRIYDALNVMIAAGLLEKHNSSIKIKKRTTSNLFMEVESLKIQQIQSRIEKKKELLGKLVSKKEAIEYWIQRNQINSSECMVSQQRLQFPLIFVVSSSRLWMKYLQEFIIMTNKSLQIFSETDVIQKVYSLQFQKHNKFI